MNILHCAFALRQAMNCTNSKNRDILGISSMYLLVNIQYTTTSSTSKLAQKYVVLLENTCPFNVISGKPSLMIFHKRGYGTLEKIRKRFHHFSTHKRCHWGGILSTSNPGHYGSSVIPLELVGPQEPSTTAITAVCPLLTTQRVLILFWFPIGKISIV